MKKKKLSIMLVSILIASVLMGCSLFTNLAEQVSGLINSPTATPPDPAAALDKYTDEEIRTGIQKTVDSYAQAYNTNDIELLTSITDPDNLPFKRMVLNRFTATMESIHGGSYGFDLTVKEVKRMPLGFVQAHIDTGWDYVFDWQFRLLDKQWVLSEPSADQLGEPYQKETEHFDYELYAWGDELNTQIMNLMEEAAQRVETKLGALPPEKAKVYILPAYSADPFTDPNALAYFQTGRPGELDSITIFAPNSYSFGGYYTDPGWAEELEDTLTHEYTHMTHKRAFDNAGKLMDWFSEGLAEFVSDSTRINEVADAIRPDRLIPIIDDTVTINQQDLRHIYLLEKDVSLAYAEAQSLIMYIYYNYDGMDSVWAVGRADDEIQNFDLALQSALGVDYETFDREWRAWLTDTVFPE